MDEDIKQEMKKNPFTIKSGTELDYQKCKDANQDLYGSMIIQYAERWAEMMEQEIENGMTVAEAAGRTREIADTVDITGYMFGFALNVLDEFWEHGEELRTWYDQSHTYGEQTNSDIKTEEISPDHKDNLSQELNM